MSILFAGAILVSVLVAFLFKGIPDQQETDKSIDRAVQGRPVSDQIQWSIMKTFMWIVNWTMVIILIIALAATIAVGLTDAGLTGV